MARALALASLMAAPAGLSGCGEPATGGGGGVAAREYLGIETRLLDRDLVGFRVAMRSTGPNPGADVDAYARCAAAQYALIRGAGFARHVRTNVAEAAGGVWRADAAYVISAALPMGLQTIDAEVTVRDCGAQGIPTV